MSIGYDTHIGVAAPIKNQGPVVQLFAQVDDRVLETWGTLTAIPVLGAVSLSLIYCVYRLALAWIESRKP